MIQSIICFRESEIRYFCHFCLKENWGRLLTNYILFYLYVLFDLMILSKQNFMNHHCLTNHKQLPRQESKPRLHLSYFKSVLLHLCRHHVLVVILQTILCILKDFDGTFPSIRTWAIRNDVFLNCDDGVTWSGVSFYYEVANLTLGCWV